MAKVQTIILTIAQAFLFIKHKENLFDKRDKIKPAFILLILKIVNQTFLATRTALKE